MVAIVDEKQARLVFEHPSDPDNEAVLAINEAGCLFIEVSEEVAVNSYNERFSCGFKLSPDEAVLLRDWLNEWIGGET